MEKGWTFLCSCYTLTLINWSIKKAEVGAVCQYVHKFRQIDSSLVYHYIYVAPSCPGLEYHENNSIITGSSLLWQGFKYVFVSITLPLKEIKTMWCRLSWSQTRLFDFIIPTVGQGSYRLNGLSDMLLYKSFKLSHFRYCTFTNHLICIISSYGATFPSTSREPRTCPVVVDQFYYISLLFSN